MIDGSDEKLNARMDIMRFSVVLISTLIALLIPVSAFSLSVDEVPNPRHTNSWTSDQANMLSAAAEDRIDARIDELEDKTGVEIAVVTVGSVDAATPRDFGTRLFNHWGIGKAGEDNGLLVLMVEDERRLEMETGYGLEPELPDAWLKRMQESTMVPHFRAGNFDRGLEAGVEAVVERLAPGLAAPAASDDPFQAEPTLPDLDFDPPTVPTPEPSSPPASSRSSCEGGSTFVYILLIFAFVVISIVVNHVRRTCPRCDVQMSRDRTDSSDSSSSHVYTCDCGFRRVINVSTNSGGSFGSSGSSFGSSGGGGSFGGGSSGGGGAGSSW